jgi:hypothetical protein
MVLIMLIGIFLILGACVGPEATPVQEPVTSQSPEPTTEQEPAAMPAEEEAASEEEIITCEEADIIFMNGQIVTMEQDMPRAEAIAISEDVISAVGSNEEILSLRGPETSVVDLGGLTLIPGIH